MKFHVKFSDYRNRYVIFVYCFFFLLVVAVARYKFPTKFCLLTLRPHWNDNNEMINVTIFCERARDLWDTVCWHVIFFSSGVSLDYILRKYALIFIFMWTRIGKECLRVCVWIEIENIFTQILVWQMSKLNCNVCTRAITFRTLCGVVHVVRKVKSNRTDTFCSIVHSTNRANEMSMHYFM